MAFNFGTPEYVPGSPRRIFMETDVTVRGESVGAAHTIIQGGYGPFRGFTSVSRRISGIEFKRPMFSAMWFGTSRGRLEITNNRISGITSDVTSAVGIVIVGGDPSNPLTGTVRVADNRIDLSTSTAQYRFGVQIDTVEGDVDVLSNESSIGQSPTDGPVLQSHGVVL